jgi:hypothetical protein
MWHVLLDRLIFRDYVWCSATFGVYLSVPVGSRTTTTTTTTVNIAIITIITASPANHQRARGSNKVTRFLPHPSDVTYAPAQASRMALAPSSRFTVTVLNLYLLTTSYHFSPLHLDHPYL